MQRVFFTVIIVLFAFGHYAYPQLFFDMSDDSLLSIWTNRDSYIQDNLAPCGVQSSGLTRDGTCMSSKVCKITKGSSVLGRGNCTVWNSCCVYEKSCTQKAKGRVVYFKSPANARKMSSECVLNIEPVNENICQMRVDILNMNLAKPVAKTSPSGTMMATTVTCSMDNFYIKPNPTDVKIPQICGANTNTHFYVHLDQQTRKSGISLNILLANEAVAGPEAASWDIRVTQLECPSREKNVIVERKRENPNQAANDFGLLAPAGCLQYYTKPTGSVKSFGYVTTAPESTLTTNQDYITCFKRYPGSRGITVTLMPDSFLLRNEVPAQCVTEYLAIPEQPVSTTNGRVCETPPAAQKEMAYISTHPGPLYVHFFSNPVLTGAAAFKNIGGFLYNYVESIPTS